MEKQPHSRSVIALGATSVRGTSRFVSRIEDDDLRHLMLNSHTGSALMLYLQAFSNLYKRLDLLQALLPIRFHSTTHIYRLNTASIFSKPFQRLLDIVGI